MRPANKGKCVTVVGTPPAGGDRSKWTPPTMHVPVNETVELQMHSMDVIHSFYVPAFLYQRDITPAPGPGDPVHRGPDRHLPRPVHPVLRPLPSVHGVPGPGGVEGRLRGLAPAAADAAPVALRTAPSPGGPAGSPAASAAAGASVALQLTAAGIAYDKTDLAAPADTPFQIVFTNNDAGIPHNVSIRQGSATGPEVFKGEIFSGTGTRTYAVPALPAGTYAFVCSVHPNMVGTLTVK